MPVIHRTFAAIERPGHRSIKISLGDELLRQVVAGYNREHRQPDNDLWRAAAAVCARGCKASDSLELNPQGHIWDTSQRKMPVTDGKGRATKPQVNGNFCRKGQVAKSPFSQPRLQAGSLRFHPLDLGASADDGGRDGPIRPPRFGGRGQGAPPWPASTPSIRSSTRSW